MKVKPLEYALRSPVFEVYALFGIDVVRVRLYTVGYFPAQAQKPTIAMTT